MPDGKLISIGLIKRAAKKLRDKDKKLSLAASLDQAAQSLGYADYADAAGRQEYKEHKPLLDREYYQIWGRYPEYPKIQCGDSKMDLDEAVSKKGLYVGVNMDFKVLTFSRSLFPKVMYHDNITNLFKVDQRYKPSESYKRKDYNL